MCTGSHPFIPVPGVFKVQMVYTLHGQRIENVFNVKSGAGLTAADADRIEAVFATWWNGTVRLQQSNNVSLVLIVLDALDSASGLHREYTTGWTQAGAVATSVTSSGVTAAVKLATGLRGRSFRGRIYWPGISANWVTTLTSQLTPAIATQIQTYVNTLRTALTGDAAGDKLVVVSYCHDHVWRTTGVATEVTSASTHLNLDSMRRRLPGRGL